MRKTRLAPSALFTLAALAGCQMRGDVRPLTSEVPPPPRFVTVESGCSAAQARFALGQQVTPTLLDSIRGRTGANTSAVAKPGDAPLAADPMRITVDVDGDGRMVGARCG